MPLLFFERGMKDEGKKCYKEFKFMYGRFCRWCHSNWIWNWKDCG